MEQEMIKCALCRKRAMTLCVSDQAMLCWACDTLVHAANFLVAKHLRVLLCRLCHSPTPWKASGPSLTPTSSLCHRCLLLPNHQDHHSFDDDEEESESESDFPEQEEEEEGENQVVPLSSDSAAVVGVPGSSGCSDDEGDMSSNTPASASAASTFPLNRFPHHSDHVYEDEEEDDDEIGCCSSEGLAINDESSSMMMRPLKKPRLIRSQRNFVEQQEGRGTQD